MIPVFRPNREAGMRGSDRRSGELFSYVDLEQRVPAKHPLRKIRQLVNDVLASLDPEFAALYSAFGRESIPPERLLRALLLQALFTIRSERQLMEQLDYNLMFRWFVGLGIDDPVWVPTVFSKTGCPPQGGNSLVTVVIDGSDEIRPRQQAFLRNQLECIKAEIPVEGRLEVYKLGSDPEQILDPVVEVCNPGRGSDFSPWTHSPKRAEKL